MHLTYPTHEGKSCDVEPKGSAGAPVHEIEVTSEMIEAGYEFISKFALNTITSVMEDPEFFVSLFRAMAEKVPN